MPTKQGGLRGSLRNVSTGVVAIPDNVVDNFEDSPDGPYESGDSISTFYGGDTGIAARQTSTVLEGSKALELSASDDTKRIISSTSGLPRYPNQGESFAVNIRYVIDNNFSEVLWATQQADSTPSGYSVRYDTGNSPELLIKRYGGSGSGTNLATASASDVIDEWLRIEVDWDTDGTITTRLFDSSDTQLQSVSTTDTTYSDGGVGFVYDTSRSGGTSTFFDDYRIL